MSSKRKGKGKKKNRATPPQPLPFEGEIEETSELIEGAEGDY